MHQSDHHQEVAIDTLIILGVFLLLSGIFVLPYILKMNRQNRTVQQSRNLAETMSSANTPLGDHPSINLTVCIGCGSCVEACPEHALGLVDGHSELIFPGKCVGHAVCRDACPVEAITITQSDVSTRSDIPVLTPSKESSVPNLFIIGELAGQALIRVAINDAIKSVSELKKRSPDHVIIVGAGPGGLTAGMACKEAGLTYTILEQNVHFGGTINHYPRRKLVMTAPIELPLGERLNKLEYRKEKLLELWTQWTTNHRLTIEFGTKVTSILVESDGRFSVIPEGKDPLSAGAVILALGRRGSPRKLNVPGEELEKVAYTLIDAAAFSSSKILIVGGGDSAIEAAMALSFQKGNEITLSYRQDSFSRIKARNQERIDQYLKSGKIKVIWNSTVREIAESTVTLTTPEGTTTLKNDEVFIFAGGELPFPILKGAGVKFGGE
ncbi:MAG: NAD(P)-binding domain-containing protein [Bacteroidetes bacterium]|nr:NAD(P)-binding domain-containing protein [Bacteroidota bacterium]